MHAAQLDKLLAALRESAGSHWRQAHKRYQVGPDRNDYIIYTDGRFQANSRLGIDILTRSYLAVQCPQLRDRNFIYYSLQSGKRVSFKVTDLEFLRPLDPMFEQLCLGAIDNPKLKRIPRELITSGDKSSEAVLTTEGCDAIRLLTALLENCR